MDPDSENQDSSENQEVWSGSEASHEVCASDWRPTPEDAYEGSEDVSPDSHPAGNSESDHELSPYWEAELEEHLGDEDASCREEEDDRSTSNDTNKTSSPPPAALPRSLPPSPSSSPSSAPGLTSALTAHPGGGGRQGPAGKNQRGGTGSPRVRSSEEGGSSDAPPACVSFGISEEGAEQAHKWDSGSVIDLRRPNWLRARHTRLSQSERHVKETKSKCKRIALLLTSAPNPHNKGALLFKKRRQRVENYTFISYGTGENVDSGERIEEEPEDLIDPDFVETSDSELEEEFSVYRRQCQHNQNWKSASKMEGLQATQGKGALMFAQRRKRMDEIVSEHEELRSKGLPVEGISESEHEETPNHCETQEAYVPSDQDECTDAKHQVDYEEITTNAPKPLVPNRTAKPFLGFQVNVPPSTHHSVVKSVAPVKKTPEPKFKVPVPVPANTSPHVWSPTADIIASRDERISVPAIKTGILPEAKRKGSSKQSPQEQKANLQNKGDRRSFIECEEDCFSLGAEACNFMQPKTLKLKNPPPVAPKPSINPACPPWMVSSTPVGSYASLIDTQPSPLAKNPQISNHWAQDQTPATLTTPASMSSQLHSQPTANSWSLQQSRSPVSMQARSPTYSPQPPPPASRNMTATVPNSVTSCPSQTGKTCTGQAGKGAEMFSKRQSRMEKFVVDAESKQVSKPRAPSPTSSLPNSWRYSSNIRAPPPLAYNPLLAPFYPPAAAKQPPSTSPKIKPKQTKQKPKPAPKHLNALDIMKHQPYQLDSALFKYEAVPVTKVPSPKPSPTPTKPEPRRFKHKPAPPRSPRIVPNIELPESSAPASSPVPAARKSTADALTADKHQDEHLSASPVLNHINNKQVAVNRPASASSQHSSISSLSDSIAAFSPASLIARGVRQMAPRPKFSAKKQEVASKQWKPVAMAL